jgi:hypothetical protein
MKDHALTLGAAQWQIMSWIRRYWSMRNGLVLHYRKISVFLGDGIALNLCSIIATNDHALTCCSISWQLMSLIRNG